MNTTVGVFVAVLIFQFSITISLLIAAVLLMVDLEVYGFIYIIGAKLNCKRQFFTSHYALQSIPVIFFLFGGEISQNFNPKNTNFLKEFSIEEEELPNFGREFFFLKKFSVEKEFAKFWREFFSDRISPHFNTLNNFFFLLDFGIYFYAALSLVNLGIVVSFWASIFYFYFFSRNILEFWQYLSGIFFENELYFAFFPSIFLIKIF